MSQGGALARRYGQALEDAIRAAVRTELARHGYSGLTFDGVAAQAQTSKPVLYRRWPTKALMVVNALEVTAPLTPTPDTGSLAGDLTALLSAIRDRFPEKSRDTIIGLMADLDDRAGVLAHALLLESADELLQPILRRGRARGELGDGEIPLRALRVPFDLMRHDALVGAPLSDADIDAIVDDCVVPLLIALSD
jgi:AcrR family transcriptional regulator